MAAYTRAELNEGETFTAYRITNAVNGRAYIGVTRFPLERRWAQHRSSAKSGKKAILYAAIRKYGVANFSCEAVARALTEADLGLLERALIAQHGTFAPSGYNATRGGPFAPAEKVPSGWSMSQSQRDHLRRLFAGRVDSPETRERKCAAQKRRNQKATTKLRGVPRSVEARRAIAIGHGSGPMMYAGVEYPSVHSAAMAAGVTGATMRRWATLFNRDVPELSSEARRAVRWSNSRPVVIGGTEYPSVCAAGRALGVTQYAIERQIASGLADYVERAA